MKVKYFSAFLSICFFCLLSLRSTSHDITFCGEKIPVSDNFVAEKLMNIIRRQIPNVNLPQLRQQANKYFSTVEYYLRATGLPDDFKYLAIVESGFANLVSPAGAAGFWQLMPATARELGLTVNESLDERNDIYKSTYAACKVLAGYYLSIKKKYSLSSWVLTAAAYNFGIGNINKSIDKQGTNYFQMSLNPETAVYVYKIIAVKELWEYPELYMKNFGYNVFNAAKTKKEIDDGTVEVSDFNSMTVKVSGNDGNHPANIDLSNIAKGKKVGETNPPKKEDPAKIKLVGARITGNYKNFEDGNLVSIELQDDLQLGNRFIRKGRPIKGNGWIIDDRVFINLGFGRSIILYDENIKQGVALSSLKNDQLIILKVFKDEE